MENLFRIADCSQRPSPPLVNPHNFSSSAVIFQAVKRGPSFMRASGACLAVNSPGLGGETVSMFLGEDLSWPM